MPALAAEPAFQRCFQFPDWRISRRPDRIGRQTHAGLAAIAFNLKPAIPAADALADGWRRLCGAITAFHLDGPCAFASARSAARAAFCAASRAPSAHISFVIIRPER